jgi:predicted metal-dependent peptidase
MPNVDIEQMLAEMSAEEHSVAIKWHRALVNLNRVIEDNPAQGYIPKIVQRAFEECQESEMNVP